MFSLLIIFNFWNWQCVVNVKYGGSSIKYMFPVNGTPHPTPHQWDSFGGQGGGLVFVTIFLLKYIYLVFHDMGMDNFNVF